MTLHETHLTRSNLTRTTGTNNNRGSLSSGNGQNNLKKLKSKYSSKISTLKELFEDWSDEDLLFALQDADGDLELTIERISAGHAVQWGEVKSKKSKKEAAKAKAVAAATASHSTTTTSTTSSSSSYLQRTIDRTQQIPQNNSERGRGSRGLSSTSTLPPTNNRSSSNTTRGKPTSTSTTTSNQQQPSLQSQAASWGKQTKPIQSTERASIGGSWASIASAPKPPDANEPSSTATTTNNNDSWDITQESWPAASSSDNNNNTWPANKSSWDNNNNEQSENHTTPLHTEQKPPIPTENSSSATSSSVPPAKTWASLLKSKPAPEPETKPEEEKEPPVADNWDAPAEDNWNAAPAETITTTATDGWDAPVADTKETSDPWTSTETEQQITFGSSSLLKEEKEDLKDSKEQEEAHDKAVSPPSPTTKVPAPSTEPITNTVSEIETVNDDKREQIVVSPPVAAVPSHSVATDSIKVKQPVGGRRLRQEEPVVLPNNTSLAGVDVKFGSLSLEETTEITATTTNARLNEHDKQDQVHQIPDEKATTHSIETQQNYLNRYSAKASAGPVPAAVATSTATVAQSTNLPTSEALTDPSSYLKQQQQQQQQIGGMDHLTSAYSSYMPNQHLAGVPGYGGINPMGSMAEYGGYGAEAQRASMGYYDPNSFDHYSPSATSGNAYQMRDKYNQEATNPANMQSNAAQQTIAQQSQQQQHHQMYPANMNPYYQYYYMPSHFNTFQQSAYGQPFLNKSMYQQVYQTSTGKPNNASASTQQYTTQQQQVQQHLYNQALSGAASGTGGYDDMSSLQHQFAAAAAASGGGNMGLHDYQKPSSYGSGGSQIPGFFGGGAAGQQQQQPQQTAAGVQQGQGKVDSSNGQYKPNSSQQTGMPNPSNYFNHQQQQQMASYSQHSQQFPMQQHMDNSQQLPQGRQQQYWNQ